MTNQQRTANEDARARHLGETVQMPGGLCTIIAWRSKTDIDVRFDDGTIVKNRAYRHYKRKEIGNPNRKGQRNCKTTKKLKNDRVGETRVDRLGNTMEIIEYHDAKDITLRVNGELILEHKQYNQFNAPKHVFQELKPRPAQHKPTPMPDYKSLREGETQVATNGQVMKLIRYGNTQDVDVRFQDGTVVTNKCYKSFKLGTIANPNKPSVSANTPKTERIGETKIAKNGLSMTIVAYRTAKDIDVRFEDGEIVHNKDYSDFIIGEIAHPKIKAKRGTLEDERIGQTNVNSAGLKMAIIAYRSSADIDIRFEDGTVVKKRGYSAFLNGEIKHPSLRIGEFFHGYHILSKAYKMPDEIFFYCIRPDGRGDVLSPSQILEECKQQS